MKSTKDYPDEVINFMRNHPTMYNSVYPVHKRPLVVRTNVDYEFTTIAVDQVTAADGSYEVLFLGTGERVGFNCSAFQNNKGTSFAFSPSSSVLQQLRVLLFHLFILFLVLKNATVKQSHRTLF